MSCNGNSNGNGGCCSPCLACIPQCPPPRCLTRKRMPVCPPPCTFSISPISSCPCPPRQRCPAPCNYFCGPICVGPGPCCPPPCPCPPPCGEEEDQEQNGDCNGNGGEDEGNCNANDGGFEVILTKDACGSRVHYNIDPCGQVCRQVESNGSCVQTPCSNGVLLEACGGCSPCGDCFVNVKSICCPPEGCPSYCDPCCPPTNCPMPCPPCTPRCRVICDPKPYRCPPPSFCPPKTKPRYQIPQDLRPPLSCFTACNKNICLSTVGGEIGGCCTPCLASRNPKCPSLF